jgi:hypothetical protein
MPGRGFISSCHGVWVVFQTSRVVRLSGCCMLCRWANNFVLMASTSSCRGGGIATSAFLGEDGAAAKGAGRGRVLDTHNTDA